MSLLFIKKQQLVNVQLTILTTWKHDRSIIVIISWPSWHDRRFSSYLALLLNSVVDRLNTKLRMNFNIKVKTTTSQHSSHKNLVLGYEKVMRGNSTLAMTLWEFLASIRCSGRSRGSIVYCSLYMVDLFMHWPAKYTTNNL